MPFSLPFLSMGPRIQVEHERVTARTGWIVLVLTLGLWQDRTIVDSSSRSVRIARRRFWLLPSQRTVSFSEVSHLAYSMIDHGSLLGDERGGTEIFDIALALHSGEEVPLFRFSGDGEFVADVSIGPFEWMEDRFQEVTDVRGSQQERSLGIAETLSQRIGVPLGPSRYF